MLAVCNSLKVRLGRMYSMSIVLTFDRRRKLVRGNSESGPRYKWVSV